MNGYQLLYHGLVVQSGHCLALWNPVNEQKAPTIEEHDDVHFDF